MFFIVFAQSSLVYPVIKNMITKLRSFVQTAKNHLSLSNFSSLFSRIVKSQLNDFISFTVLFNGLVRFTFCLPYSVKRFLYSSLLFVLLSCNYSIPLPNHFYILHYLIPLLIFRSHESPQYYLFSQLSFPAVLSTAVLHFLFTSPTSVSLSSKICLLYTSRCV